MKILCRSISLAVAFVVAGAIQAAQAGSCTPEQIGKMIDKGFSKDDIKGMCGYSNSSSPSTGSPVDEQFFSSPAVSNKFTDNGDGTVTDKKTGLMWQKDYDERMRTWNEAINYCNSLSFAGYSNWRLPNKGDLISLWSNAGSKKEVRDAFSPDMQEGVYWSSSPVEGDSGIGSVVYFEDGSDGGNDKMDTYNARCVRLGK